MSEEDLRIQQIKMKIKGLTFEQARDISRLCSEYYIEGLEQSRFDKRMLEQEKQQLKELEKEHQKINGELREELQKANDTLDTHNELINHLQEVIEEVREYIKEWQKFPHTNGTTHEELKKLLQILDKGVTNDKTN